jgi:hypothetical protein
MKLVTIKSGTLRGNTLQNGAKCIESWQINQDDYVVLALREHSFDPYVVWYSDAAGNCRQGDYCQTIGEALGIAERRAGL